MAQGLLPFHYEAEQAADQGITALAGLGLFLDLIHRSGLPQLVERGFGPSRGGQGFTDRQQLEALILLNLAGGEGVDDIDLLEKDGGLGRLFQKAETHGLSRRQRRELAGRFRRGRERSFPSPSSVFRWLATFHDPEQEELRAPGRAFIPAPNLRLKALSSLNGSLCAFAQANAPSPVATLDLDATLIETGKRDAFFCYKSFKAYQPLNVFWAERELMLHSEFRDGNVPAGFDNLRVLKDALALLPEGVKKVRFRADSASYQHGLLAYLEDGTDERFGRIEFAVSADVSPAFKAAASLAEQWRPLPAKNKGGPENREWAEVCFVPAALTGKKCGRDYRYLAVREPLLQPALPGMEAQLTLPFPTMDFDGVTYKIRALVTNRSEDGAEVIRWSNLRCGKSEHAHSGLKADLAGGRLPSGDFGENAAWWLIAVMAYNLSVLLKRFGLGGDAMKRRLKWLRFHFINLPARVVSGSRRLKVRLCRGHPSLADLVRARARIAALRPA
jgi:hypothetical protein